MPTCRQCKWRKDSSCELCVNRKGRFSHLRGCDDAVIFKWLPKLSGNILEIGFGQNRVLRRGIRKQSREREVVWFGVDPRWPEDKEGRILSGSAAKIGASDCFFDFVWAGQTMEHWGERGDDLTDGVREVSRVLKPGGTFVVTVPIFSHGNKLFLTGDIAGIGNLFKPPIWEPMVFEEWRKVYEPLDRAVPEGRGLRILSAILDVSNLSSWILEFFVVKSKEA